MTTNRFIQAVSALLALALRVSAQGESNEPIERLGLDITGIERAKAAAPGAPAAKAEKRPKGPTEITGREATFDNRIHVATFSTEVTVRDPEFGLSSDRLTVYLKKPPVPGAEKPAEKPDAKAKAPGESSSGIEKAIAEGRVIITQDKVDADGKPQHYTAKANRAVFDNTTGSLTLYGWPQISQGAAGNITQQIVSLEESTVITLNRIGKVEAKGPYKCTLQDASQISPNPR
jgi:lipopolysaccharide export system protein LptA